MSSKPVGVSNCFYSSLGLHSFLIGLFPFYIPVYLIANGFTLRQVGSFIAITGIGYCLSLFIWDRMRRLFSLHQLIVFSFCCEIVLLSLFFLEKNLFFLVTAGFINGVYNCNFWIIQRLLFVETVSTKNSGRKFGNFQLFVLVILKTAIFFGGVLLEHTGFLSIYVVSFAICSSASIFFLFRPATLEFGKEIICSEPIGLMQIIRFRDNLHSRKVFIIDGIFLYLESYFWVISLYLIVDESFTRLGLLIILLTVFFGLLFILIKNTIDKLPRNVLYYSGVLLYSLSWLLRGLVDEGKEMMTLLVILALVTFCTSLFRLTFNKRFFDCAKTSTTHEYIFLKSYFSQFFLLLFMIIPTFFFKATGDFTSGLSDMYMNAAVLSLVYLFYKSREKSGLTEV